jgi:hypothetical protein
MNPFFRYIVTSQNDDTSLVQLTQELNNVALAEHNEIYDRCLTGASNLEQIRKVC